MCFSYLRAVYIYTGSGSSPTKIAILHHHVSTVAQNGQTEQLIDIAIHVFMLATVVSSPSTMSSIRKQWVLNVNCLIQCF